jgi:hypothetical protein
MWKGKVKPLPGKQIDSEIWSCDFQRGVQLLRGATASGARTRTGNSGAARPRGSGCAHTASPRGHLTLVDPVPHAYLGRVGEPLDALAYRQQLLVAVIHLIFTSFLK